MTNTDLKYREISLPRGIYESRMAALNACLKTISGSAMCIEKIAIFEDPPHAILHISNELSQNQKRRNRQWLPRFIKANPQPQSHTTLKLDVDKKSRAEKSYILKYEINPA